MKFGKLFSWLRQTPNANIGRVRLIVIPVHDYPWVTVENDFLDLLLSKGIEVVSNPIEDARLNEKLLHDPRNEWRENHDENTFLIIVTHDRIDSGSFRVYSTSGKLVAAGEAYGHYSTQEFAVMMFRKIKKMIAAQLSAAA